VYVTIHAVCVFTENPVGMAGKESVVNARISVQTSPAWFMAQIFLWYVVPSDSPVSSTEVVPDVRETPIRVLF
jgi:hypothetical protein